MSYLRRMMTIPATESQMALALGLSVLMMAVLLCGLIWQSQIINYQRQVIHFLWNYR